MKSHRLSISLIALSFLGYAFLGLTAGLVNLVTNEYVDNTLPDSPTVWEYDFRMGGRYWLLTGFLLIGGVALALFGSTIGIYSLYESREVREYSQSRELKIKRNIIEDKYEGIIHSLYREE